MSVVGVVVCAVSNSPVLAAILLVVATVFLYAADAYHHSSPKSHRI
jgi:hypothetical protein